MEIKQFESTQRPGHYVLIHNLFEGLSWDVDPSVLMSTLVLEQ